jgi:ectoine hydroxylase-related dioxygenase (phytanoyl-CoA dioxygenase family)
MRIGANDVGNLRSKGAVCLKGFISQDDIGLLHRGVDRNIANPSTFFQDFSRHDEASGSSIEDHWSWEYIPEYQHFFRHSGVAEAMGELLGCTEVRLLEDQYVQKMPGTRAPSPWHQDQPFYRFAGQWLSLWIALDRIEASESLMIVEGSHLPRQLHRPLSGLKEDSRAPRDPLDPSATLLPALGDEPPEWRILNWSLESGDAIAFDPFAIHGASGNRSQTRARRFVARFAAEDVRIAPSAVPWATIIAGHGLEEGDLLRGEKFPLLWRRTSVPA